MNNRLQRGISAIIAAFLIASLASCNAKSEMKDSYPTDSNYQEYDDAYDVYSAGAVSPSYAEAEISGGAFSSEKVGQTNLNVADSTRKLIKNVDIRLETKEFDTFQTALNAQIAACGGYVQSSALEAGGYYSYRSSRYATLTVRVPADRLDEFCAGISEIANVVSLSQNTNDVTRSYYDMESHVKALRSEYDTLIGILEKCTALSDVISVQSRITEVLYQIESYQTQLNHYDQLVTYSTVTLSVSEVERETAVTKQTTGQRILSGLEETWSEICEGAQDLAVSFVVNLPFLLMWAAIILAVVWILRLLVRRFRRKRAQRKQANPPQNEQKP